MPPELVTARLTLRRLTLADAPFVVELLNQPSFLANIGDRGVRNVEDAHRYLRDGPLDMYRRHGFGLWHVSRREDGAPIGLCGLLKREVLPDVDVGYALFPDYWRRGYATELVTATVTHARLEFALERLVAIVSPGNVASIRVLERAGFAYERDVTVKGNEPPVRLYGRSLIGPTGH